MATRKRGRSAPGCGAAVVLVLAGLGGLAQDTVAQQTLVLADGDQLTGTLVGVAGSTWTFAYRGQNVGVDVADVVTYTAPDAWGFRLDDNTVVAASVTTSAGVLTLTLADGSTRTLAPSALEAAGDPGDLEALQEVVLGYFTPFGRFWKLSTALGASLKDGNSNTSGLNFRLDLDRNTARDRLTISLLATQEENPNADTGERELTARQFIGDIRADLFPWEKAFIFAQNRYTRDRFADLDLRVNLNGGAGYRFILTDNTDLRAALGVGGRYEDLISTNESSTEGTWNVNGQWLQKFGGFEFSTAVDVVTAFSDVKDYQILNDNNLTATIVAGLGCRVGLLVRYDNTPSEGFERTDLTFATA